MARACGGHYFALLNDDAPELCELDLEAAPIESVAAVWADFDDLVRAADHGEPLMRLLQIQLRMLAFSLVNANVGNEGWHRLRSRFGLGQIAYRLFTT